MCAMAPTTMQRRQLREAQKPIFHTLTLEEANFIWMAFMMLERRMRNNTLRESQLGLFFG